MFNLDTTKKYNPLYFLAALGAGGLAITFFLYPMFLIEHPDTPLVTFHHIFPLLNGDNLLISLSLGAALALMLFFAALHLYLLIWNFRQLRQFKQSDDYQALKQSNAEVSLMAIPLTLAMSINVSFALGAVFVPGLWSVVEYLFPVALLAFSAVGFYALKILGAYFSRLLSNGGFDFANNNNLSQMVAIFALAMIAVGMAAPGAMSHIKTVNAIGMFGAIFFLSLAFILAAVKLTTGFQSIIKHGVAQQTSPSLWIMIPILTLFGITIIRLTMGLHHGFSNELSMPRFFVLTSVILSLQILVGLIGYHVMKRINYFRDYVDGNKTDGGSFALICPGVALFVFGFFFLTFGLVKNGLVTHLSLAYFVVLTPFIMIQLKTIQVFFKLTCHISPLNICRLRALPN